MRSFLPEKIKVISSVKVSCIVCSLKTTAVYLKSCVTRFRNYLARPKMPTFTCAIGQNLLCNARAYMHLFVIACMKLQNLC